MKRVYKRVSQNTYYKIIGKLFCEKDKRIFKINESDFSGASEVYLPIPNNSCEKICYIKNNGWTYEEDKYYVLKELL